MFLGIKKTFTAVEDTKHNQSLPLLKSGFGEGVISNVRLNLCYKYAI